jgi:hypothetical protein
MWALRSYKSGQWAKERRRKGGIGERKSTAYCGQTNPFRGGFLCLGLAEIKTRENGECPDGGDT